VCGGTEDMQIDQPPSLPYQLHPEAAVGG
jgi:hypothetical protein